VATRIEARFSKTTRMESVPTKNKLVNSSDQASYDGAATVAAASMRLGGAPSWLAEGHLNDDLAKTLQTSSDPDVEYMCTLKKPALGMRAETSILTTTGAWIHFSGPLTWIGKPPSSNDLEGGDSLFWNLASNPDSTTSCSTEEEKRDFILHFLGAVNGQRIKSIARLSTTNSSPSTCGVDHGQGDDRHHNDHQGSLPVVAKNTLVEITYQFQDTMYYPWAVGGLRIMSDQEVADLPPYFCEFCEGCSCPHCASKQQMQYGESHQGVEQS
jgi:hypothetical protein